MFALDIFRKCNKCTHITGNKIVDARSPAAQLRSDTD